MTGLFQEYVSKLGKEENYKELLLNLLAIMHGDGGHYTDKHGVSKSVLDAIDNYYKLKV